jgi:hypothetical protein
VCKALWRKGIWLIKNLRAKGSLAKHEQEGRQTRPHISLPVTVKTWSYFKINRMLLKKNSLGFKQGVGGW